MTYILKPNFQKRKYPFIDIFPELSPTGGTISVTGYSDQDYLYFGESISFTATHQEHWQVAWSDTSETDLSRSITIDSLTPTIEATFSPFHTILMYRFLKVDLVI